MVCVTGCPPAPAAAALCLRRLHPAIQSFISVLFVMSQQRRALRSLFGVGQLLSIAKVDLTRPVGPSQSERAGAVQPTPPRPCTPAAVTVPGYPARTPRSPRARLEGTRVRGDTDRPESTAACVMRRRAGLWSSTGRAWGVFTMRL